VGKLKEGIGKEEEILQGYTQLIEKGGNKEAKGLTKGTHAKNRRKQLSRKVLGEKKVLLEVRQTLKTNNYKGANGLTGNV